MSVSSSSVYEVSRYLLLSILSTAALPASGGALALASGAAPVQPSDGGGARNSPETKLGPLCKRHIITCEHHCLPNAGQIVVTIDRKILTYTS